VATTEQELEAELLELQSERDRLFGELQQSQQDEVDALTDS